MKVYESAGARSLQYVWQPVGRKKGTEVHSRGCFEILRTYPNRFSQKKHFPTPTYVNYKNRTLPSSSAFHFLFSNPINNHPPSTFATYTQKTLRAPNLRPSPIQIYTQKTPRCGKSGAAGCQATYVHAEHGLHFEVSWTGVQAEGEGWRGDVPDGAHDGECQQTNGGGGEDSAGREFCVQVEGLPGAAPGVHAAEAEHRGVQPGADVVQEPVLVRVQLLVENVLGHVERVKADETDHYRGEAAEHRVPGVNVDVAEAPGASPVADDRRRDHGRREHRVQDREYRVMETAR